MATVRLRCDGPCGAVRQAQPGVTIAQLRKALANIGWQSYGNRDVCPSCITRGVRP